VCQTTNKDRCFIEKDIERSSGLRGLQSALWGELFVAGREPGDEWRRRRREAMFGLRGGLDVLSSEPAMTISGREENSLGRNCSSVQGGGKKKLCRRLGGIEQRRQVASLEEESSPLCAVVSEKGRGHPRGAEGQGGGRAQLWNGKKKCLRRTRTFLPFGLLM